VEQDARQGLGAEKPAATAWLAYRALVHRRASSPRLERSVDVSHPVAEVRAIPETLAWGTARAAAVRRHVRTLPVLADAQIPSTGGLG
jgi:hypothetical protein